MNTWPITIETNAGWTFVGVPDRLGDGQLYRAEDAYPTLEEVAGEDWSAAILRQILPRERAWAWWTRTEAYKASRLSADRAPERIAPRSLDRVVTRRLLLEGMSVVFVPGGDQSAHEIVTQWAGADTEQIPDHIWVAPDEGEWDSDAIISWCTKPSVWTDPMSVSRQPVERIVVMFDGQIFCALPSPAAALTIGRLGELAARWGLSVIPGPAAYAWPALAR